MLIPNHPHDERLSALASGDPDATADASLSAHVVECLRCTGVVDDLRLLTVSLAELPDLPPHRPLRLLPEVSGAPSRADRLGGWARRLFAPALTAGAALAMVGLVGTAAPALNGMTASGGAAPQNQAAEEAAPEGYVGGGDAGQSEAPDLDHGAAGGEAAEPSVNALSASDDRLMATDAGGVTDQARSTDSPTAMALEQGDPSTSLPAERSPWPMVLFSGVAVMIAAALLRWILAPRAA